MWAVIVVFAFQAAFYWTPAAAAETETASATEKELWTSFNRRLNYRHKRNFVESKWPGKVRAATTIFNQLTASYKQRNASHVFEQKLQNFNVKLPRFHEASSATSKMKGFFSSPAWVSQAWTQAHQHEPVQVPLVTYLAVE